MASRWKRSFYLVAIMVDDFDAGCAQLQKKGVTSVTEPYTTLVLPLTTRTDSADVSATAAGTAQSNPYTAGLPEEMQQKLAQRYADLFAVFVQHRNVMGRVTFWGVTDGDSWLNNFPTRGRTNYPLLFDREGKPEPAFAAVLKEAIRK